MLAKIKLFFIRRLMKKLAKKHKPQTMPSEVKNIAVWQFGGLGDMLLATPVLSALASKFPDADIHVWCSHPQFADFLLRLPQVQSVTPFPVYDFDTRTLEKKQVRYALNTCVAAMQRQKVEVLVNLHRPKLLDWWMVEWQVMAYLKPALSLGFQPNDIQGSLLDVSLPENIVPTQHYTQSYQQLLQQADISCGRQTYFPIIEEEKQAASEMLSTVAEKTWFCLHMGGRRLALEDKLWSVESFLELTQQLVQDGFTPVLLGVESEAGIGQDLCDEVPQTLNLIGKTNMGEMAAVVAQAPLLIGHDSGPFHLAVAVQTPVVVICPRHDAEPEYLDYAVANVHILRGDNPDAIDVIAVHKAAKGLLA